MNLRPSGYEPDELPAAPPRDRLQRYGVYFVKSNFLKKRYSENLLKMYDVFTQKSLLLFGNSLIFNQREIIFVSRFCRPFFHFQSSLFPAFLSLLLRHQSRLLRPLLRTHLRALLHQSPALPIQLPRLPSAQEW